MNQYIPPLASLAEAGEWLRVQTGAPWPLARILEYGVRPWFWLDDTYGKNEVVSAIFGGRREGYLAPVNFAGDLQRLAADGTEARITISTTADGSLLRLTPALRVPVDALRFKREDLERLAQRFQAPEAPAKKWTPERIAEARAMRDRLKAEGARDYAAKTAAHYGVSPARLRELLAGSTEPTKAPAPKSWPEPSRRIVRQR